MYKIISILFFILCFLSVPAFALSAGSTPMGTCSECNDLSLKEAADMLRPLKLNVKSVKRAPMSGMFEVLAEQNGSEGLVYIDCEKKFLMQGVIVDASKMEVISSHPRPLAAKKKLTVIDPKSIPIQHSVVMGNPNANKKLYVFTDPDCPHCRIFHSELLKLETMLPDLAIHVFLYPLPSHPQAYDKSRLLVSTKEKSLLNLAFDGKDIPQPKGNDGKNSIDVIIKFANSIGVDGTPTIIMSSGAILAGARDAESLKKLITGQEK